MLSAFVVRGGPRIRSQDTRTSSTIELNANKTFSRKAMTVRVGPSLRSARKDLSQFGVIGVEVFSGRTQSGV